MQRTCHRSACIPVPFTFVHCLSSLITILTISEAGYVAESYAQVTPQELAVRSLYHLYSLKTKSSRCHYIVMTRSETKLSVAIPAPVSGQSAVNVAMATSKCLITFLLPYDQDGDVKTKPDNVSNIL